MLLNRAIIFNYAIPGLDRKTRQWADTKYLRHKFKSGTSKST